MTTPNEPPTWDDVDEFAVKRPEDKGRLQVIFNDDDETVVLNGDIADPEFVKYLEQIPPEKRAEATKRALETGSKWFETMTHGHVHGKSTVNATAEAAAEVAVKKPFLRHYREPLPGKVDITPEADLDEAGTSYATEELQRAVDEWRVTATDTVEIRDMLVEGWTPPWGVFTSPLMVPLTEMGACGPPAWELQTSTHARLWYVTEEMCDLLERTAPKLNPQVLHDDLIPDRFGLVVFGRPLKGMDADGSDNTVYVGAMLWGPGRWRNRPNDRAIGITNYRPAKKSVLIPIGALVWNVNQSCDEPLLPDDEARNASMAEDRRRLMALWLLASQTDIVEAKESYLPRHVQRQMIRAKRVPPTIRTIHLRKRVYEHPEDTVKEDSGRRVSVRYFVNEFWRNQPYGPRPEGKHRQQLIPGHWRGPEDGPVVEGSVIKVLDR